MFWQLIYFLFKSCSKGNFGCRKVCRSIHEAGEKLVEVGSQMNAHMDAAYDFSLRYLKGVPVEVVVQIKQYESRLAVVERLPLCLVLWRKIPAI